MINPIGIITAITTFLTIWFGHVMVRKLESRMERIAPAVIICILLGFGFGIYAVLVESNTVSAIFGILGITFLWDALEFYRQEKRIKVGHAPANPNNPRHADILAQYSSATTVDLLNREPRGKEYSAEEISILLQTKSEIKGFENG
ncbi:MAG: DUF4491 family protein [Anaerolineaceae bacterium]|nr:DUF4491 family protein [Anaerolineaceae bacterium]